MFSYCEWKYAKSGFAYLYISNVKVLQSNNLKYAKFVFSGQKYANLATLPVADAPSPARTVVLIVCMASPRPPGAQAGNILKLTGRRSSTQTGWRRLTLAVNFGLLSNYSNFVWGKSP